MAPVLSKEFPDIQATAECRFTFKRLCNMIKTHSQMHHTDRYSKYSSWKKKLNIKNWSVWLNGWVFVYKLSASGFESHCIYLTADIVPVSSMEYLDIQATTECRFTLKFVCDIITQLCFLSLHYLFSVHYIYTFSLHIYILFRLYLRFLITLTDSIFVLYSHVNIGWVEV